MRIKCKKCLVRFEPKFNDVLCAKCNRKNFWYYLGRLQACKKCGSSKSKHRNKGFCVQCYEKARHKKNQKNPEYRKMKVRVMEEWKKKNIEKFRAYQRKYHKKLQERINNQTK